MKLPSQLSYTGSIKPTHAHFYYRNVNNQKSPIPITLLKLCGTKSAHAEGYTKKGDMLNVKPHDLAYGNPQIIRETCYAPASVESVLCDFSLNVLSNSLAPETCHDDDVNKLLVEFVARYSALGGFKEQARRVIKNLLSGTWLFRNQFKRTTITIRTSTGLTVEIFDTRKLGWNEAEWSKKDLKSLNKLSAEVEDALTNMRTYWYSDVSAKIDINPSEELFPSQELDRKVKGKKLFSIMLDENEETAALHDVKIGAGLGMIDDWYEEEAVPPIRVHEFGRDKQSGVALRRPATGKDFYSYIKNVESYIDSLSKTKTPNKISNDIHYVIAVLIKGGVFGV